MSKQQITNYQRMLLKNAYKSLTEDTETNEDNSNDKQRLPQQHLESYKAMSKEIENKPLPLFSNTPKVFKPEDFYDEEGNEVETPVESQEALSENTVNENSKAEEDDSKCDCFKCRYFYITWDPKAPRGCKFFKFTTAQLPSEVVHTSLGQDCKHYFNKFSEKFETIFAHKIDNQELPSK